MLTGTLLTRSIFPSWPTATANYSKTKEARTEKNHLQIEGGELDTIVSLPDAVSLNSLLLSVTCTRTMAAVLDALAPYVKELIVDMLKEEVYTLLGISSAIKKLEGRVESLKDILTDAERRRITDQSVQRWVQKLKDVMYDATDILDVCQLKAKERQDSMGGSMEDKLPGCFQPFLFCLQNPVFVHKLGSSIKKLNQRLDVIRKEADEFRLNINLYSYAGPRTTTKGEHDYTICKSMSEFDESAIVGDKIEKEINELVQILTTDDKQSFMVVSIVGMGGMGKTTLAQKIFNEMKIQQHFKTKIWLSINQHFDEVELLRTAIHHAGGRHDVEQDRSLLTRILTNTLSTSKFLLVMDDVWSDKAWNHVLSVPVINATHKQPGSRVIVTTRFEDLAEQMQARLYQHHVSPLDRKDAWSLLKKQLLPDQVLGIHQLKHIGMEIVEKCGGLPLAIKVMGGLLSRKYPSEREWMAVLKNPAWSVAGLPHELDNRVYMSYEDMSPQLKQCFLYCSLFPKGEWKIARESLIGTWISEGFIQPLNGSSSDDQLEEIAMEYHRELIMRNLIEPTEKTSDGHHCTMHDVIRAFAEFMAREEALVVQDDQSIPSINNYTVRRLSIGQTVSVAEFGILQKQESLRTLIIKSSVKFKPGDSLSSLSRLRVLNITNGEDSDRLFHSLRQLKHLRYLHLRGTDISRLPHDIDKMKFLQHIILINCRNLCHLPCSIIKLVNLRTLDISNSGVTIIPKGFGGLTNLRRLFGFPVHMDMEGSWCSLEEIVPLSQLRRLRLDGLENISCSSLVERDTFCSKENLGYLELNCSSHRFLGREDEVGEQRLRIIETVFDSLCPPTYLETLCMKGGYFGRRLPNWMMAPETTAFMSLRWIHLEELTCCTQIPNGLCRLPSLESLVIEDAPAMKRVGSEFQGSSSTGFPKLRYLRLVRLCEWEEWEWKERGDDVIGDTMAMPALEILYIDDCKLRHLPPGIANSKRRALRELTLYNLRNLTSVENFASVINLNMFNCSSLKTISCLPRLQKITIKGCPNLEVLEGVPSLDSMELNDASMETIPSYLPRVNLRYLALDCNKKLYESLLSGSSERDNISHISTCAIDYSPK